MSNENKLSAAQEAVAWQRRYIGAGDRWFSISKVIYEATKCSSFADRYEVRELYAAPVTAAPGIDRCSLLDIVAWWNAYTGPVDEALGEVIRRIRALIDASPKSATFPNDGNSEAQFIADGERLNCPACGGSGHVEDSPKGGSDETGIPEPHQECYSNDDGDSWRDSPDDAEFVDGLTVGDTYVLTVSHYSVERTYRVTKAPDETSDDYEVEPVQATSAEVGE